MLVFSGWHLKTSSITPMPLREWLRRRKDLVKRCRDVQIYRSDLCNAGPHNTAEEEQLWGYAINRLCDYTAAQPASHLCAHTTSSSYLCNQPMFHAVFQRVLWQCLSVILSDTEEQRDRNANYTFNVYWNWISTLILGTPLHHLFWYLSVWQLCTLGYCKQMCCFKWKFLSSDG